MKSICAMFALFIGLFGVNEAIAADASKPDAAAITSAMYAAIGVGNIDAAVSFFADDGSNTGPSGRKTVGKNDLRTLMGLWVSENAQIPPARDVKTQGEHSIFYIDISTKWEKDLGVAPTQQIHVVDIEGNKIKSLIAWFPPSELERLTAACNAHPDFAMPSGASCGTIVTAFKKHTDNLISQGIAEKN